MQILPNQGPITYDLDRKYALPTITFGSDLVKYAFDLERLRGNFGLGSTPPAILSELHDLFQLLMGVVSARIEGNRTTVLEALTESTRERFGSPSPAEGWLEIRNLLQAMAEIDRMDPELPLSHVFVRQLHELAVADLIREGDPNPGAYRTADVEISQARHTPPSHVLVRPEMSDWLEFANRPVEIAEQMVHVAMAHHRFLWIHPFSNGNGRVSRLLSYAMLRRHGFLSPAGYRTVNPTAVFGNDREEYYSSLALADDLSNEGTAAWCTFFVRGIHEDMERLTRLQDVNYLMRELLEPAIDRMVASGASSQAEGRALRIALRQEVVKAGDLQEAFPGAPSQRSVAIRAMLDQGILRHATQGPRFYRAAIATGPFSPFVVRGLDRLGFLPRILKDDPQL
ncbi:Fic family protein [Microcella alkaliphila]|uniref:Fido domain-containing protein n=1 Tax=Microcella alkaliphila TaxID=279828 RepID=A0A0U4WUX1_9MICO|nr:Fic family protein [Microcella alkaliphila]BAU31655.1 uncharacterized protein MalAC0309_0788 [Microcella alkaliphila]